MPQKIPNIQLRAWRDGRRITRAEMADALNRTATGQEARLNCDEKRLARRETGEVLWPHAIYRRALYELTGRDAEDLGFVPQHRPYWIKASVSLSGKRMIQERASFSHPDCPSREEHWITWEPATRQYPLLPPAHLRGRASSLEASRPGPWRGFTGMQGGNRSRMVSGKQTACRS